jgi:hypothetical protein
MQLTRKSSLIFGLLLSLLILSLHGSQVAGQVQSVDERQIEVKLMPDKPTIMLGEPVYLSFVVQNNSDQDLQVIIGGDYRNALGRPESFAVTVIGEDGKPVSQPDAGPGMGGLLGPQKIPARGSYTFKLFLLHWATFEKTGSYSIVARRTMRLSRYIPGRWNAKEQTTDMQAQASATVEIVSQDREKMGEVIQDLGTTMLGGNYDKAESAAYSLSYIQDERVIPYFIKALATNNYSLKFSALGALAKFNDEAAFQALKRGLETKGEDIGDTTTKEVANQLADNIRLTAAAALSRSPHPGAIPFLLSKRDDPLEGVRITILHVLGKMRPEEAIPVLQEMTQDKDKRVSDEAIRYLNLFSSK